MEIRSRFSERQSVVKMFTQPSKTKPEFKESCDIAYILAKYQRTNELPLMQKEPIYGDFSTPTDYQDSLNLMIKAENQFDKLPADVRKKFDNNPKRFLEFVNDENNHDEMVNLGLLPAKRPEITTGSEEPPAEDVTAE